MSKVFSSENPEFPRVKITDAAMNSVNGDIAVDLEGINELLRDDLGLEKDITPNYVLYGRSKSIGLLGLHVPYTHTAFVQVPASLNYGEGPSSTLIHESVHLVDSVEHKFRTAGELALRGAATVASSKIARAGAEILPGPVITDAVAYWMLFMRLRMGLYYHKLDPSENRARDRQNDPYLAEKYRDVVRVGYGARFRSIFDL